MDKSDNAGAYDYRLAHNPGTGFRFRLRGSSGYVDSGPVSANTWHTVIAWHDSANDTLNIQVHNGTVTTVAFSAGATNTVYPLSIGASSQGTYLLDGRIDEVALYKRVLTGPERTWLYNNGQIHTYPELIGAISYSYGDSTHPMR